MNRLTWEETRIRRRMVATFCYWLYSEYADKTLSFQLPLSTTSTTMATLQSAVGRDAVAAARWHIPCVADKQVRWAHTVRLPRPSALVDQYHLISYEIGLRSYGQHCLHTFSFPVQRCIFINIYKGTGFFPPLCIPAPLTQPAVWTKYTTKQFVQGWLTGRTDRP